MDIANLETGEWIIVELGDGQVSGLPDNADLDVFYERISENNAFPKPLTEAEETKHLQF